MKTRMKRGPLGPFIHSTMACVSITRRATLSWLNRDSFKPSFALGNVKWVLFLLLTPTLECIYFCLYRERKRERGTLHPYRYFCLYLGELNLVSRFIFIVLTVRTLKSWFIAPADSSSGWVTQRIIVQPTFTWITNGQWMGWKNYREKWMLMERRKWRWKWREGWRWRHLPGEMQPRSRRAN